SVLQAALGFNIDPVAWKTLREPAAAGFGYKVAQLKSGLLVSAPHALYSQNRMGLIYKCSTTSCGVLPIPVPDFAVNMSLGLTMTSDQTSENTLVCGPTIPKDCKSITKYNGACFEINKNNRVGSPIPSSLEVRPSSISSCTFLTECQIKADIAILLDGSGSVTGPQFITMKTFVKNLIESLLGRDTQVFSTRRGSRPNVKKVLIVITDGVSHDADDLGAAAATAERENIVRFAIGVGGAFDNAAAKGELDTISSSPSSQHVFQVSSFDALEIMRESLQERLFSIEGSDTSGDSLEMEMAQEGFSAAYVPGGIQMATVGAFSWRGGYQQYSSRGQITSFKQPMDMDPNSYLGYSMAVGKTKDGMFTILGAPRYQHRGVVWMFSATVNKIDPFQYEFQIGMYFGAEVCTMDVDSDSAGYTDLILISAPMFTEREKEGRVYVCGLTGLKVDCQFEAPLLLEGDPVHRGRFGSSLAPLPDVNSDRFNDLAVGAPLENDGQGSIYIFNGEGRGTINPKYSQRIAASNVQSGLQFFGLSISQSSFDLSGDSLPDLAVGSKGSVLLLRSKPIVMVEAQVTFNPTLISTDNCSMPLTNRVRVCFTMILYSAVQTVQARINYTLTLDATRKAPNYRAYVTGKQRAASNNFNIDLRRQKCFSHSIFIEACPDDALNELSNELVFTFEGLPSSVNLRPSLAQQAQTTTYHPLGFEIHCGTDNKCVDNLKVDFDFTRSSEVRVGIDELLNVTVTVWNRAENSYNSRAILTYPDMLSYRKFTVLQGRVECNSLDSKDGLRGTSDCTIDKPIFRGNTKAVFIISYGIDRYSQLDRKIFLTANVTSGNLEHSSGSELYQMKEIDVNSLQYRNFTFGENNLQKPVQHSIKVLNVLRAFNVTVLINVPVKLGDKDIWVDPTSIQDCSVAWCAVFKCNGIMGKNERNIYNISANLSSGWIEQIGLDSAKFLLVSTVSLEYDRDQYIFFSTGSTNNPPIRRIETEVEVYPETNLTKEIVGGSLGGLLLLALITAGLFKAGFFKSRYKQMLDEAGEGEGATDKEATLPAEQ
ncbi:integrin alpha-M-like, partial [Diretmus argenteus]